MLAIREARMAGTWYPARAVDLQALVDGLLGEARRETDGKGFTASTRLGGLLVPHAGYVYSGAVAARAYAMLSDWKPRRVVVLAPSHREWFPGASVWKPQGADTGCWRTPLGDVEIDGEFRDRLLTASPLLRAGERGHGQEHSLELQLPFLQRSLGAFRLVPVSIGDQSVEVVQAVAEALASALGEEPTLLVASTDLSHFHPRDEARRRDADTLEAIRRANPAELAAALRGERLEACGAGPVVALLEALRIATGHAPRVEILDHRSSADAGADPDSVVGYGAAICRAEPRDRCPR